MKKKKILILSSQARETYEIKNPVLENLKNFLEKNSIHDYRLYKSTNKNKLIFYIELFMNLIYFKISNKYDFYHCHFGGLTLFLLGFLKLRTISTYHGTDLHSGNDMNYFKRRARSLINYFIFKQSSIKKHTIVSKNLNKYIPRHVLPIKLSIFSNFESFYPIEKDFAKKKLNLSNSKKYILFSDISNSDVKRLDIAKSIEDELKKYDPDYSLLIMSKVKPDEVIFYINSSDFLLLTSDNEGSPSIIKECLLCNTPVYSYDVGDIKEFITNESGYIIDRKLTISKQAEIIHSKHSNMSYKFSNSFSQKSLVKEYEDLYD